MKTLLSIVIQMVSSADQKQRILYTKWITVLQTLQHLQWRCLWWSVQLGTTCQWQSASQKAWKSNLPPSDCKQHSTSFFVPKFMQQSATLNTLLTSLPPNLPPIHATSSSRKLPNTIMIDYDIDLEGTPIKTPLHPLLRQLQAAASRCSVSC